MKKMSCEEKKFGFKEKIKDFFVALLCVVAVIAFIAGTIALLVLVVFPLSSKLTVKGAWAGVIYLGLMIFFINLELKKKPQHNLFVHCLLSVFFPIWLIVWMYNTTDYLNVVPDEKQRNTVVVLILLLFVPGYSIYWMYQSAKRIDLLAIRKGISTKIRIACLILSIVTGALVPSMVIQRKINLIEN